jgi:hypothetical protein
MSTLSPTIDPRSISWIYQGHIDNLMMVMYLYHTLGEKQAAQKLYRCGGTVCLRHYPEVGTLIHYGRFCGFRRACPICAALRRRRLVARGTRAMTEFLKQNPGLKLAFILLTVVNDPVLLNCFDHLNRSWKRLLGRRADALRGRGHSQWAKVHAGIANFEVERGSGSGDWHVHAHVLVAYEGELDIEAIRSEWRSITGDSHIVDVRPVQQGPNGDDAIKAAVEATLGYSVKHAQLSRADRWQTQVELQGKKLTRPFGDLRGFDVPEREPLEPPSAQQVFVLSEGYWQPVQDDQNEPQRGRSSTSERTRTNPPRGERGK